MSLVWVGQSLPPTSPEALEKLAAVQEVLLRCEQIDIRTEHVLHGGLYARTLRLQPGAVVIGALIKIPTMIIVKGHCSVLVNDEWHEVIGYNVFPAGAGRKQLCIAFSETVWTMLFPTQAKTVEEAEKEFTDDWRMLMSSDEDLVVITGQ